jgi:GNAT acetyltransferase-like protein/acetyltransferase (GNAT) family protein
MNNLEIRTMTRPELDWAIDMAAVEGWNPGLHDADAFYASDPDGFLIALQDGKPVGCVSAVDYGEFGFIGFFIVCAELRGGRIGIELGNAAMARLQGKVIGVDGVFDKQSAYSHIGGFEYAWSNIRFAGKNLFSGVSMASDMVPASAIPLAQLEEFDQRYFSVPRPDFLKAWLNLPESTALVLKENKGDGILGYGTIRKCRSGYKIGPLFVVHQIVADMMFVALCSTAEPDAPIYLDVPDANKDAITLAKSYGMEKVFGTARMYLNGPPDLPVKNIFGITTFELG